MMTKQTGRGALRRFVIAAALAAPLVACTSDGMGSGSRHELAAADQEERRARHLDRMFEMADADRDGKLTREELATAMERHEGMGPHHGMGGPGCPGHGDDDGPGPGPGPGDGDGDGPGCPGHGPGGHGDGPGCPGGPGPGCHGHGDADSDGDGQVSDEEREAMRAQHREQMFSRIDTDGNGALSAAELAAGPGPARMMAERLAAIDTDGDGAIDRDELAAHMAAHHPSGPR